MSETGSARINTMVVHILDNNLEVPILSEREHPIEDDICQFVEGHIEKALSSDNLKSAAFIGDQNRVRELCQDILTQKERFIDISCDLANMLFDIMKRNGDIPPADVIFCLYNCEGVDYLGVLKFNYRDSYIHHIRSYETGRVNSIIKQKTALPGESQKIDECAFINLRDMSIKLLEKKYEIDGEKRFYFSEMFLECSAMKSVSEKVKIFTKATEKFAKKYFGDDLTKPVEIKKAIVETIDEKESIDVQRVADRIFRYNPQLKSEYIDEVQKTGLDDMSIKVSEKISEKSFRKQKIKTDTGIEINLPVEYYGDKDKIEFVVNPDGTISIIIKNVGKLVE